MLIRPVDLLPNLRSIRRAWLAAWIVGALCVGTAMASGQRDERSILANSTANAPQNASTGAQDAHRSGTQADARNLLETARRQTLTAADDLQAWLATAGPPVVEGWNRYLQWDLLQAELRRPQPDVVALGALCEPFYRNQAGLEKPQFLALRERLQHYTDLAAALRSTMDQPPRAAQALAARQELSRRVEQYGQDSTSEAAHEIARRVGQLRLVYGAAHPIVAAADRQLDYPNGYIQISQAFIAEMLERPITNTCDVDEQLMGTTSHGTATTRGRVFVNFLPNDERGVLEIRLRGKTVMDDNVAHKGPATIYSSTNTSIDAHKRVEFDATGLHVSPTRASCTTDMSFDNISADRRVVERIAWRRAEKLQPELQQAASRKAEERVQEMFDEEANAPLVKANDFLMSQFRNPVLRMGVFPETFRFSTQPGHLRLTIRQRDAFQLGAPGAPPAADPTDDMTFLVHESLVNNSTEMLLGGRQLDDKQLLEFMKVLTGSAPRALWVHERTERWSLQCAKERPLEMAFRDGLVTITFRLGGVKRRERYDQVPVTVSAAFEMQRTSEGAKLTRQGQLQIDLGPSADPTLDRDELTTFLRRKFRGMLQPEIYFDGLVPPAGNSWDRLRHLEMTRLDARNGWLTIAYRRQNQPASPIAQHAGNRR